MAETETLPMTEPRAARPTVRFIDESCLHSDALSTLNKPLYSISTTGLGLLLTEHRGWDFNTGWKNLLNNLRLILQPFVAFNLMKIWLKIFPIPELDFGFHRLIAFLNRFRGAVPTSVELTDFHVSSA